MLEEIVLHKYGNEAFKWSDIKDFEFHDNDVILMGFEAGDESTDWKGHYYVQVTRMVPETDEEYTERQKHNQKQRFEAKERRRQNYLKLKEEFENSSTESKEV